MLVCQHRKQNVISTAHTVRIVGGNHQIYQNVLDSLESKVLLNSKVVSAQRNTSISRLTVSSPDGNKSISAKHVLVTIATTGTNMAPLAPDTEEEALFSQSSGPGLWVGLVKVGGLAPQTLYTNAGEDTQPEATGNH